MGIEHRDSQRIAVSRLAFARDGDKAHGGLLRDLSRSGAYIEFHYPMGRVEHSFQAGEAIELILDNGMTVTGKAARIDPEGIALEFDAHDTMQAKAIEALIAAEDA